VVMCNQKLSNFKPAVIIQIRLIAWIYEYQASRAVYLLFDGYLKIINFDIFADPLRIHHSWFSKPQLVIITSHF